jgi:pilus assembly protein CpaE
VLVQAGQKCPPVNMLRPGAALADLAQANPELVVVVLSPNAERGLGVLSVLRLLIKAKLLVIGPVTDPKLVVQAVRQGATDFVDEAHLEDELFAALDRMRNDHSPGAESAQIIAVLGPNGGSGSSTLAVNIATVLAQKRGKALLVDMKLEAGDLAALLDVSPSHSLADICQGMTRMDRTMFEGSLVTHSSGVRLLAAPQTLSQVRDVTPDGIRHMLGLAKTLFPYVVLDVDHSFRDEQLQALRVADPIFLVFRLDFASLRHAHRTLEYLGLMGVRSEVVRVVVNRHGQPQEVPVAKAEEALGVKIAHLIPEDAKTVNVSNNNGVPMVIDYAATKVAKSIAQIAESVLTRAS